MYLRIYLSAFLYFYLAADYVLSSDDKLEKRDTEVPRVSYSECAIPESERHECGYLGIRQGECQSRGCCWKPSQVPGAYWCYHSNKHVREECLAVRHRDKIDCGYYGMSSDQCAEGGCCWMPTQRPNTPWCFHSDSPTLGSCGLPAIMPSVNTRIVGGVTATPHSWPWQTSIRLGGRHHCGGSLIHERWVLSAAHCGPQTNDPEVVEQVVQNVIIVLGAHNKDVDEETQVKIPVENIITYTGYNRTSLNNDVMLMKLAEPVTYNDVISPVCLPAPGEELGAGMIMQTTGWGRTSYGGETPSELQQLTLPVWENAECEERGVNLPVTITDNMICAGYMEEGRSSCHGDSGGPLVRFSDGRWSLYGVVSWGYLCGADDHAGLYAKVINYLDWIHQTMRDSTPASLHTHTPYRPPFHTPHRPPPHTPHRPPPHTPHRPPPHTPHRPPPHTPYRPPFRPFR